MKKILFVDDEQANVEVGYLILKAAGYEVETACDGRQAWAKMHQMEFDAVFSDILMPNMNGMELAQLIRSERQFDAIPLVAVTAKAANSDRHEALASGFDHFFAKPYRNKEMIEMARAIFAA